MEVFCDLADRRVIFHVYFYNLYDSCLYFMFFIRIGLAYIKQTLGNRSIVNEQRGRSFEFFLHIKMSFDLLCEGLALKQLMAVL